MADILSIIFPIFTLIGAGYVAGRTGYFPQSLGRGLSQFVMKIALPTLVILALSQRAIGDILNPTYLLVYLFAGLAAIALTYWITGLAGTGKARRAVAAMGASCPNSGFVGYPMMLFIMPDHAGLILALNMLVENFFFIPVTMSLFELSRDHGDHVLRDRVVTTTKSVLRHPFVIAIFIGAALSAAGVAIPPLVERPMEMVASASAPVALFAIGVALVGLPLKGNIALASFIATAKLLLLPALVLVGLAIAAAIGLPPLIPELRMAIILSAAIPMITTYPIFAAQYGHEGIAALAMLIATIGSAITLSLILLVMAV